ncbi:MAG: cyclomaltodextrinase [Lachnospiraceae bacterium]|nr:cyclomaltodextrinase [Lachnospiraceae bacterium]
MWAYESVFYQIYPLGLCGAPFENPGAPVSAEERNAGTRPVHSGENHSILKIIDWIDHLKKMNINAVYFSPLFESDTHGYNTRDYTIIDSRIGTNEDFKKVCEKLHEAGIRVVLDGVFNHVGRGFWAFQDVLRYRWDSIYKDWFNISFDGNSNYNDGLWYEGWEGNYDLVKLNLWNDAVVDHIFDCIKGWVDEFDIDGLRLDVAYCLPPEFLKRLRAFTNGLKDDFFLLGECLHGDYNRWMADDMCHSVTNYECYKGLYSSFNSMNMFEICHSLQRQFGSENWCLYRGRHLLSFVDNHDVSRIASILNDPEHIKLVYSLAFGMPGIPCVYYGSEWGEKADKSMGDPALRPCFDKPLENDLTEHIAKIAKAKKDSRALCYGDFRNALLTNKQCIIERKTDGERVLVCINAEGSEFVAHFDAGCGTAEDLISGTAVDFGGGLRMPPYSSMFLKMER